MTGGHREHDSQKTTDAPPLMPPKAPRATGTRLPGLRSRIRHAVEGSPPTWGMRLQAVSDGVEEARARAVIDLTMRIAEALLTTGSSAADVTATALQLVRAYGLRSVHVDVTYTSITVSHHRGATDDPVTIMRVVSSRTSDFDRLGRIQDLVAELAVDPVPVEEARRRFTAIMQRPHPYRRAVVTAANAVLAGFVAALLNGTLLEICITVVTATVIDRSLLWVFQRRLAAFFGQIVGGAIPTAVAVALMYARAHHVPGFAEVSPSIVVTAAIVVLLAGLQLVGAAQDAIDGYYVTATGRAFEVLLLTLGVVVGILVVLGAGARWGAPGYIAPSTAFTPSVAVQIMLAALVSAAFGISTYAGPRTVLVSMASGAIGWATYVVATFASLSVVPASALGAFSVGLVAQALGRICRVPALAITTAGIVTLLPGGMVYRGLYDYAGIGADSGLGTLATAASIGLALAAGVSLGTYVGRPVGEAGRSRAQTAALGRALSSRSRAE
ncbi:hypothetical protein KEM60_02875 [Austwickia sp. TVS 96-490-7B]|uniref:threonine/serine ThrE exporter family protein n=1 Tax=Austwickia sp. TVS 96-490-7B TaxID=2830843 RepID=UPI001C59569D|nr:threonine/serine exporter family protein [Austwickia sp. TVS 96-490-7B]MBW3086646.1 hypothetical protein [Austwickia sp. TVS 96-490-7B]